MLQISLSFQMAKLQALEDINGKPILQNVRNLKQNRFSF